MCIVSFEKTLHIIIHNQYPSLELMPPVYFSDGAAYCISPNQRIDTGNTMETSFGIDSRQKDLKCVSLYKLQRKHTTETNNQPNNNTTFVENTATNTYLLVAWVAKNYDRNFCVCLVEFTDDFAWDEDKLWALYMKYNDQFHMGYEPDTITWSMHDNTVVKTKIGIIYGSDYKLDVVISEGIRKSNMKKPMKIDPKRLVLSLSMLIALMYIVRLNIKSSFKLNIYNQCLNVDLVSPIYITGEDLDCHRPPNYKVCAGDTMNSAFIIIWNDASYGALIYKLQKEQPHEFTEISEDTSSDTHLLVIWEISESEKLCADVLLVEHDKGLDWNKDDLEELYHKNSNQFRLWPGSVTETWSLGDNIALMTTFKMMNRNRILDITISEVEKDSNTRTPARIDLKR
jgi:hypothetical protein